MYIHLTQDERYQISAYNKMGKSITEISLKIGRNKGTVSRELRRNCGHRGYRPKQAQEMAQERFKTSKKAIKLTPVNIKLIDEKIQRDWSPEQVSGRLKKDHNISISHETIYKHLLADKKPGGLLHTHLRCQKKRRKKYGTKPHDRRGQIKNKVSIELRPKIVE